MKLNNHSIACGEARRACLDGVLTCWAGVPGVGCRGSASREERRRPRSMSHEDQTMLECRQQRTDTLCILSVCPWSGIVPIAACSSDEPGESSQQRQDETRLSCSHSATQTKRDAVRPPEQRAQEEEEARTISQYDGGIIQTLWRTLSIGFFVMSCLRAPVCTCTSQRGRVASPSQQRLNEQALATTLLATTPRTCCARRLP